MVVNDKWHMYICRHIHKKRKKQTYSNKKINEKNNTRDNTLLHFLLLCLVNLFLGRHASNELPEGRCPLGGAVE